MKKQKGTQYFTAQCLAYLILIVFALTMLVPFLWMISISLKQPDAVFNFNLNIVSGFIPYPIIWKNYIKVWEAIPFGRFFINTLVVSVFVTAGQVITSSLAAFAFARLIFPGRDKIFFAYLATMMIPAVVTMIPVFVLLRQLGQIWNTNLYLGNIYLGKAWGVDSYFALIIPSMFTAYGTFMLRQFFMSLPKELEEAAEIDGCSIFGIFWRITLPLCKPALATLTTFVFMWSWKDFLWPLIVTSSTEMRVLSVGLASFQGLYNTDWTLLMAGSIIMLIPIIIIFIFNQRFFIEGIQLTGIKG
jgi:multiple sugar transport system permease protein